MKSEKGFTLVDSAISIIILFIFVSLIAFLIYSSNSVSREVEYKSTAMSIAIDEIEAIKNDDFENYESLSLENGDGILVENEETDTKGFYKTITIEDYTEIKGTGIPGLVKRVTVKINYNFKGKIQEVTLATPISKES